MDEKKSILNINSEIGKLKAVLLHRPGSELERITPRHLGELLFEDIPWLKKMQVEHDNFANQLIERGVKVYYVEELLKDILLNKDVKIQLIKEILDSSLRNNENIRNCLEEFFMEKTLEQLISYFIGGVCKEDISSINRDKILSDYIKDKEYFYINPLPNLYFMRDPATIINNGISINAMNAVIRRRESLFIKQIYKNHPLFYNKEKNIYYNDDINSSIEGGDILVLNKHVIAVGCSQRTNVSGIELFAKNILTKDNNIQQILVVEIPKVRAYMHLDTVFTMIDYDKFTIYPGIVDKINIINITRGKNNDLIFKTEENLENALKKALKLNQLQIIQSGGGNPIVAAREQWNDSTNTLAIEPGKVIAYSRNEASNEVLRKNGIEVIDIPASELVRGRGGPRCMSMPLNRQAI